MRNSSRPSALLRLALPFLANSLLLGCTATIDHFNADDLARFQGTYRFADGTCVTGGRMDENGVGLLYMDIWKNRMAMYYQLRDGNFVSVIPLDSTTINFDNSGNVLKQVGTDGSTRSARRVQHPETRPARFSRGDMILAGTLYSPADASGKLPGVVLAHGSGPVDRYAGTRITFFTGLGFAVLSYDKRGVGESTGDWQSANYLDLAGDLDAAVEWLAEQPEVDSSRIGIHTTSQSGWYGPWAAQHDPKVRFLIQRAGPGLWIGPVTRHENISDWRAAGIASTDIAPAAALWERLNLLARDRAALAQAQRMIDSAAAQPWFDLTFGDDWRHVDPDAWQRRVVNSQLDPAETAARLGIPVLWFLADQDQNVPYEESLTSIESAATKAEANVTVVTIHDAPHSFLVADADGRVHYTDHYWPEMADWLREQGFTNRDFSGCGVR